MEVCLAYQKLQTTKVTWSDLKLGMLYTHQKWSDLLHDLDTHQSIYSKIKITKLEDSPLTSYPCS